MFREAEVSISTLERKKKVVSMQQRDANTFEVGATWAEKPEKRGKRAVVFHLTQENALRWPDQWALCLALVPTRQEMYNMVKLVLHI